MFPLRVPMKLREPEAGVNKSGYSYYLCSGDDLIALLTLAGGKITNGKLLPGWKCI